MARTIYCDEGDGLVANYMFTNLDTGEMVAMCSQHFAAWVRTLADAIPAGPAEVPPDEATAGAEAAREAEAATDTARPKRRRNGREAASEALTSPTSPFTDPTPIDC